MVQRTFRETIALGSFFPQILIRRVALGLGFSTIVLGLTQSRPSVGQTVKPQAVELQAPYQDPPTPSLDLRDPPPLPQASLPQRREHLAHQEAWLIPENYDLRRYPLVPEQERHWRSLLWATALREPEIPEMYPALTQILTLAHQPELTPTQTRILTAAFQVTHQLYGPDRPGYSAWQATLTRLLLGPQPTVNPDWAAFAFTILMKAGATPAQQETWLQALRQRFPRTAEDQLGLNLTLRHWAEQPYKHHMPPVEDWRSWRIQSGELQLFVLCHQEPSPQNRSNLCHTLLQDGQGHWVRRGDRPWSIPLSGRSLHGLPWYLSRGQTPQGIYRMEGLIPQPDQDFFYAYGYFPLVNLYGPGEEGVTAFAPPEPGPLTSLSQYQRLLPPRWRSFFPVQESYWASRLGRGLFRIHGTGEAVDFFANSQRYPNSLGWNPAIGCLTALETYTDRGELERSDLQDLLRELTRLGGEHPQGYVIVLDVPDPLGTIAILTTPDALAPQSR